VTQVRQKHLVLIIARELAANLATPTVIADEEGTVVFYNEPAEQLVGRKFAESVEMPMDDWTRSLMPRTRESKPLPPERRPAQVAFDEKRAAHLDFRFTSADGIDRDVAVTAFPLFAHLDEFVGVMVIFWGE
jgi:PAS domain-containing protein